MQHASRFRTFHGWPSILVRCPHCLELEKLRREPDPKGQIVGVVTKICNDGWAVDWVTDSGGGNPRTTIPGHYIKDPLDTVVFECRRGHRTKPIATRMLIMKALISISGGFDSYLLSRDQMTARKVA